MDGIHAGLSALDWTDGSAPSLFRISVGVFTGFGTFSAQEAIGLKEDGITLGSAGLQVGFGTMGFEAYARYFPDFELSGVSLQSMGFGLKYELSKLIPGPLLPATGIYVDYNTLDFGVNKTRTGDVEGVPGLSYETKAGIDMSLKTINIGLILSKDLIIVRFYGKLAYELGSTDITWNYATGVVGQPEAIIEEANQEFDNNGLRYGVGLTLLGFRAEVGGRGSHLYLGVGYGLAL